MGPLRRGEVPVSLWRRYVCCTVVLARVYPRCHSVQVPMGTVHPLSLPYAGVIPHAIYYYGYHCCLVWLLDSGSDMNNEPYNLLL
jgi:hypothetical protein